MFMFAWLLQFERHQSMAEFAVDVVSKLQALKTA